MINDHFVPASLSSQDQWKEQLCNSTDNKESFKDSSNKLEEDKDDQKFRLSASPFIPEKFCGKLNKEGFGEPLINLDDQNQPIAPNNLNQMCDKDGTAMDAPQDLNSWHGQAQILKQILEKLDEKNQEEILEYLIDLIPTKGYAKVKEDIS